MNTILRIFSVFLILCSSHCRDYYIGMFKRNDFLVAQDRLYKEKVAFQRVTATYGRSFTCPITYFRVVDRLGYGGGPNVLVIRGGLRKKYIVARLTSPFNLPISVNVYVGCANKMTTTKLTTTTLTSTTFRGDSGNITQNGNATGVENVGNTTGNAANETNKVAGGEDEGKPNVP